MINEGQAVDRLWPQATPPIIRGANRGQNPAQMCQVCSSLSVCFNVVLHNFLLFERSIKLDFDFTLDFTFYKCSTPWTALFMFPLRSTPWTALFMFYTLIGDPFHVVFTFYTLNRTSGLLLLKFKRLVETKLWVLSDDPAGCRDCFALSALG